MNRNSKIDPIKRKLPIFGKFQHNFYTTNEQVKKVCNVSTEMIKKKIEPKESGSCQV